jgi:hypothetical protein
MEPPIGRFAMQSPAEYTDFHRNMPFFVDYTAWAIDIEISHRSMDNQQKRKP